MLHEQAHPLAGQTVNVQIDDPVVPAGEQDYEIEDWWDRMYGKSWMFSNGNPSAMKYAVRSGFVGIPLDDEVVYGKINGLGHVVHVSELKQEK